LLQLLCKNIPIIAPSIKLHQNEFKYENSSNPYVEYDCCLNGCTVYVGVNNTSLYCKVCNTTRFIPCCKCTRKGLEINKEVNCSHNSVNKIAQKTIRYRSIKYLLIELLQYETFREVLKYQFENPDDNIYQSTLDGKSHARNMREMEDNFNTIYKTELLEGDKIEPIYITGSWFYDGIQTNTTVMKDMAPVFFSIHNLPHCLRNDQGVGSFLLSLFTFKKGGTMEKFLMNDCFISELKDLAEGFQIVIENITYFVQFRLICHIQDLIGFNGILQVQNMAKSKAGCIFCNCGCGRSIYFGESKMPEVKYDNTRLYLSLRHPTRTNGYSRLCCPKDFYEEQWRYNEFVKGETDKVLDYQNNQIIFSNLKLCQTNNPLEKKLKNFLDSSTKFQCPYNWFDDKSEYKDYRPFLLWYPHACYKPRVDYKRTDNDELIRRILLAIEKGEPVRGVKGAWWFLQLFYTKFESDVSPSDSKHDLKAILVDQMNLIKNDKTSRANKKAGLDKDIKAAVKKAKTKSSTYSELKDKNDLPPWAFQEKEQLHAQAYLNCLLVPYGSTKDLSFPPIFEHTGFLKISQLIKIFTTVIDLILLASTNMKFAYKQYHRLFARLVNRMQSPTIIKKDVIPLFWRAREWLGISEGLFPLVEMTIMKHFLPDIIMHIPEQGPLHGFHTLSGEQLIGKTKRKIKKNGGTKVENDAYDKSFELESVRMKQIYGKTLEDMKNPQCDSKSEYKSLRYDLKTNLFKVNYNKNDYENETSFYSTLSSFEYEKIVDFIYKVIEAKYLDNKIVLLQSSSFCRVVMFIKLNKKHSESLYMATKRLHQEIIVDNIQNRDILCLSRNNSNEDIYNNSVSGKLMSIDFKTLQDLYENLLSNFEYKVKALINGKKHHARGFSFSEKMEHINRSEILWSVRTHNSSWCKLNNCYAQLNYVFSVTLSEDSFASSLQIASVTSRTTRFADFSINYENESGQEVLNEKLPLNHIDLNIKKPISANISQNKYQKEMSEYQKYINDEKLLPLFVLLDEILPTKVASIGFCKRANTYIPIHCGTDNMEADYYSYKVDERTNLPKSNPIIAKLDDKNFPIQYLGLIDISPENVVQPETQLIFDEIEWMDDIWDERQSSKYVHKS